MKVICFLRHSPEVVLDTLLDQDPKKRGIWDPAFSSGKPTFSLSFVRSLSLGRMTEKIDENTAVFVDVYEGGALVKFRRDFVFLSHTIKFKNGGRLNIRFDSNNEKEHFLKYFFPSDCRI